MRGLLQAEGLRGATGRGAAAHPARPPSAAAWPPPPAPRPCGRQAAPQIPGRARPARACPSPPLTCTCLRKRRGPGMAGAQEDQEQQQQQQPRRRPRHLAPGTGSRVAFRPPVLPFSTLPQRRCVGRSSARRSGRANTILPAAASQQQQRQQPCGAAGPGSRAPAAMMGCVM